MKQQHQSYLFCWLKGFMLRRIHGMITCKEFEDFVLDYLDDELPALQRSRFNGIYASAVNVSNTYKPINAQWKSVVQCFLHQMK